MTRNLSTNFLLPCALLGCLFLVGGATAQCNVSAAAVTFDVHDDGTVTHIPTGLMWKRCPQRMEWDGESCTTGLSGVSFNWQQALAQAQDDNFAGYDDWRLPNVKEMNSVFEERCHAVSFDTVTFPETPVASFWTSSPDAGDGGKAWTVRFHGGETDVADKDRIHRVRLVRGGQ